MTFFKNFAVIYLASVASMVSAVDSRDLTVCDSLKACFLVDIETREETELTGVDKLIFDPTKRRGYSIRCDVNGKDELDFIKFSYDGTTFDEFGEPRYMAGDSDQGGFINKADYLSSCGNKAITVQGNVWSNPCFERTYVIVVSKADGSSCDTAPVKAPTNAPVKAPTNAPVKLPTKAPVKPPTKSPVKPPTKAPVRPPTNAPFKPPTRAPVKPPTRAPVKPPTRAPVKPPTNAPVKPPTNAPIRPPAPVFVFPPFSFTMPPISPIGVPPAFMPIRFPAPAPRPVPVPVPVPVPRPVFQLPVPVPVHRPVFVLPVPAPVRPPVRTDTTCPHGQYWVNGCCKPIPTCPYGQAWINGCCQTVCRNNFVCPINSSRIPNRACYDSFDDCECRYGYYKSYGHCVRHSWCYW